MQWKRGKKRNRFKGDKRREKRGRCTEGRREKIKKNFPPKIFLLFILKTKFGGKFDFNLNTYTQQKIQLVIINEDSVKHNKQSIL